MISNPPELLPDRVTVEWPLDKNGDPTKKLVVRKQSNVSPLEGLIFDRSMTLVGMIESGASLAEVKPIDLSSNDPNDRYSSVENAILREMMVYPETPKEPVSEPEPEPVVNLTSVEHVNE